MANKYLLRERQVEAGLWEALNSLLGTLEFTLGSSAFHSYILQRMTGAMKSCTGSRTNGLSCIWRRELAYITEVFPTSLATHWPCSSKLWLTARPL